ncbi:benzoate 4-monooxygenase [Aspergillus steynii IBT 23096]|uniref:Benzoate 4-monooxygenase n=1 Tax=Aspergillus steynii IBT 23096 TaxID=1392250 RepID=A0A2I2GRK3_9EURO|nr:benzoate 4-monooxygenase [Aspergillus steynii IBT 23096]PLB55510.1 benzoate 4-monooxygenase [Aspergillus steynii IBT 23096]
MVSGKLYLISSSLGVLTHLAVFIKGEWDTHAPQLASYFVFWPAVLLTALAIVGYGHVARATALALLSYESGIWLSMIIYRWFYHPLRHFPGPALARVSALWSLRRVAKDAKWQVNVQELHKQYGTFVRIKPREISINDASAIKEIYGVGTTCTKGVFYDLNHPNRSLQMCREKAFHSRRRRVWDLGFNSRALTGYEPFIREHCDDLVERISSQTEEPILINDVLDGFAWDAMGILAFGRSFGMVKGNSHPMLDAMRAAKKSGAFILTATWMLIMARHLPVINSASAKWVEWCAEMLEERRKMGLSRKDLFSYLIAEPPAGTDESLKLTDGDLVTESELAIGAGSQTTGSTMNALLFLLAKHPNAYRKLQEEIDAVLPPDAPLSHSALTGKPYLEGCINEVMRLYPAVMSGVPRETGPRGLTIDGVFIPAYTTVSVPTYTVHRDPRNYQYPDEFIPERWIDKPELIIRKEAFIPFSTGPYSCAGKSFGMMEMRLVIATIVRNFDFRFPEGQKGSLDTLDGTGVQDCFTMVVPSYDLIFTRRDSSSPSV